MAGRLRLGRFPWLAVAATLALLASGVWWRLGPAEAWAWYAHPPHPRPPVLTWWTAALVHFSAWHLVANLWAAAAVAAWGQLAGCRARAAGAWLLAWPLSQALLVTDPGSLWRYAGLSATLHAGVAIGCWQLIVHRRGAARAVGLAVLAAVALKLMLEMPGLQALWQQRPVAEIPSTALSGVPGHVLAGHAHGCGVLAGLIAAALLDGIMAWRRSAAPSS